MENYFSLLSLNVKFDLTNTEIRNKYIEAQFAHHPDKVEGQEDISALINQAYLELSDPLKRAKHIFDLNKIVISNMRLNPSLFQTDPKVNYNKRFVEMGEYFAIGDLEKAYSAWCDCKYLQTFIRNQME